MRRATSSYLQAPPPASRTMNIYRYRACTRASTESPLPNILLSSLYVCRSVQPFVVPISNPICWNASCTAECSVLATQYFSHPCYSLFMGSISPICAYVLVRRSLRDKTESKDHRTWCKFVAMATHVAQDIDNYGRSYLCSRVESGALRHQKISSAGLH